MSFWKKTWSVKRLPDRYSKLRRRVAKRLARTIERSKGDAVSGGVGHHFYRTNLSMLAEHPWSGNIDPVCNHREATLSWLKTSSIPAHVRAGIEALFDMGRPASIQLALSSTADTGNFRSARTTSKKHPTSVRTHHVQYRIRRVDQLCV
jgi:hypothetical protein